MSALLALLLQAAHGEAPAHGAEAVLYTNQGREIRHPTHVDVPLDSGVSDKFRIAVFHVNTCNGKTVIGDQAIESVENQLIVFENVPHYGTVQTDTDTRVVINFALRLA